MPNIIYRHPEENEAREIFEAGCKCFNISRFPYSLWNLRAVRRLITAPNIAWVGEMKGHIVAFAGAHAHYAGLPKDHGFLEWCFVLPEYRRRGICSELVRRVEHQYLQLNKHYIVIDTTPDNKPVRDFLRREGYELYAEDVFYRKKIPARPSVKEDVSHFEAGIQNGSRLMGIFQSPETFIGSVLYAIIVAQLFFNFDLRAISASSIFVFFGLFITIARWCHLYVSLVTKEEFQYSTASGFVRFIGFWLSILMLGSLLLAVRYQADLELVCYSFGGLVFFDLLWELNTAINARKTNKKPLLLTAKRWIAIDLVCIPVLAGIVFGVRIVPEWSPLGLLSGEFHHFLFLLLTCGISIWDYLNDHKKSIGFYF